jgi:hypothetical protein
MSLVERKGNKVQVALPTGAPSFAGLRCAHNELDRAMRD